MNDKPKVLLFIAKSNRDSKLAELVFKSEALKNDVFWTSLSRTSTGEFSEQQLTENELAVLSEFGIADAAAVASSMTQANIEDLKTADLVVHLRGGGEADLRKLFPGYSGNSEVWKNTNCFENAGALRQSVSNLIVRLIMKGGKRAPIVEVTKVEKVEISKSDKANSKVRVSLDAKGRKGKKVSVVTGLPLEDDELEKLAAKLKQLCGSGGTVKDGDIEIQGDHVAKILAELQKLGYKPKRSGG